jgi:hypothetical protein
VKTVTPTAARSTNNSQVFHSAFSSCKINFFANALAEIPRINNQSENYEASVRENIGFSAAGTALQRLAAAARKK